MKKERYFPWPNTGVYATCGPDYEMGFRMEGHDFNVRPIAEFGLHSNRQRFEVRCISCGIIVHAATTSPSSMINTHLDDAGREAAGVIREQLAAYAHEAWSGWMKYLFSKCCLTAAEGSCCEDGAVIPQEFVDRWQRQLQTPYAELPENEKESDRVEADKILAIINGAK